ncbi:Protein of unknown function [Pseudonocardia ammonioxydans]|uniref:DUF4242 domain-containing protein n=1 Tax=Pseudonocardia ammonioxydans TaxID=260086 RepID=A0A1I5BFN4_PSUAM|nr:DUF4242 domain-containing protein [Pseudonocardia ammonioxydans]SFN73467.1 Protein of unknown function [Pseudonocardia ammonioxydans]
MSLFLFEFVPSTAERSAVADLLAAVDRVASAAGGTLIESQVTGAHDRVFTVVEAASREALAGRFDALPGVAATSGPDEVRLVGADLDALKAARPGAGYLVEWDLPDGLDMDTYLERKKAKAPRYADVPEVSFLRTYVREDMEKCLCFYDAPGEEDVVRGRKAVDTPIDRLHTLAGDDR